LATLNRTNSSPGGYESRKKEGWVTERDPDSIASGIGCSLSGKLNQLEKCLGNLIGDSRWTAAGRIMHCAKDAKQNKKKDNRNIADNKHIAGITEDALAAFGLPALYFY